MVLSAQARIVLFWGVCIPSRVALTRLASGASRELSEYMRIAAFIIGARWVAGLQNGRETMFGGPAWWANERFFHGLLWLSYSVTGDALYLGIDTGIGAINWIVHKT